MEQQEQPNQLDNLALMTLRTNRPKVESMAKNLQEALDERAPQISWVIDKATKLHGEVAPANIRVLVALNPLKGQSRAEPMDSLAQSRMPAANTDIIYWISPESRENSTGQVRTVVHETVHRYCHYTNDGHFYKLFAEFDEDPEIKKLIFEIFGTTELEYMMPTLELVTTYLESLIDIAPKEVSPTLNTKIAVYNSLQDELSILNAAKAYQKKYYPEDENAGPYAGLLKGFDNTEPRSQPTKSPYLENINKIKKPRSPYFFRGKLDTKLLEEYITKNKIIDKEFVIALYEMAITYMKEL